MYFWIQDNRKKLMREKGRDRGKKLSLSFKWESLGIGSYQPKLDELVEPRMNMIIN